MIVKLISEVDGYTLAEMHRLCQLFDNSRYKKVHVNLYDYKDGRVVIRSVGLVYDLMLIISDLGDCVVGNLVIDDKHIGLYRGRELSCRVFLQRNCVMGIKLVPKDDNIIR